jgi:hypothetical protein
MPSLHLLHERTFAGKPLQSFKVYNDPFGESEVCVELAFADGQVACLSIGPGRPQIVSCELCFEGAQDRDTDSRHTASQGRSLDHGSVLEQR